MHFYFKKKTFIKFWNSRFLKHIRILLAKFEIIKDAWHEFFIFFYIPRFKKMIINLLIKDILFQYMVCINKRDLIEIPGKIVSLVLRLFMPQQRYPFFFFKSSFLLFNITEKFKC